MKVATCIGCGCQDDRACMVETGIEKTPCFWIQLDRKARIGVCSACPKASGRWRRRGRAKRKDRT